MSYEDKSEHTTAETPPLPPATGSVRPCCDAMNFALNVAIIRRKSGCYRFGSDVLPSVLNGAIVACPWCGKVTPNNEVTDGHGRRSVQ